jgi:hypothetical protein
MPAYAIPLEVVTTMLITIRILSRFNRNGGRLGVDDIFVVLAWMTATTATGLVVWGTFILVRISPNPTKAKRSLLGCYELGFDRHIWDTPQGRASKALSVRCHEDIECDR